MMGNRFDTDLMLYFASFSRPFSLSTQKFLCLHLREEGIAVSAHLNCAWLSSGNSAFQPLKTMRSFDVGDGELGSMPLS